MRPAVLVPPSLQTGVRTHLPTTSIWCARMPRPPPTPHCVRVHTDALHSAAQAQVPEHDDHLGRVGSKFKKFCAAKGALSPSP